MDDSDAFYLLLRKIGDHWRAEMTIRERTLVSPPGSINQVAAAARTMTRVVVGQEVASRFSIRVVRGTMLDASDILELIEANEGSQYLDLTGCLTIRVRMGPEELEEARISYLERGV